MRIDEDRRRARQAAHDRLHTPRIVHTEEVPQLGEIDHGDALRVVESWVLIEH